jgi:hypothetical protein
LLNPLKRKALLKLLKAKASLFQLQPKRHRPRFSLFPRKLSHQNQYKRKLQNQLQREISLVTMMRRMCLQRKKRLNPLLPRNQLQQKMYCLTMVIQMMIFSRKNCPKYPSARKLKPPKFNKRKLKLPSPQNLKLLNLSLSRPKNLSQFLSRLNQNPNR